MAFSLISIQLINTTSLVHELHWLTHYVTCCLNVHHHRHHGRHHLSDSLPFYDFYDERTISTSRSVFCNCFLHRRHLPLTLKECFLLFLTSFSTLALNCFYLKHFFVKGDEMLLFMIAKFTRFIVLAAIQLMNHSVLKVCWCERDLNRGERFRHLLSPLH